VIEMGRRIRRASFVVVAAMAAVAGIVVPNGSGPVSAAPVGTPTRFVAIQPCRLLDTRQGVGWPLDTGQVVTIPVVDRCGVPAEAVAASVTVTVAAPAGWGYMSVGASGVPLPPTSTLNWTAPMETRANGAIVALGTGGSIDLFTSTISHVVVDVAGYFVAAESSTVGRFVPLTPQRVLDTRDPMPSGVAAGQALRVALPAGVPTDATAVFVNLTTTASLGYGYFAAYAAGTPVPATSVLNTDGAGQTRAAGMIVPVSAAGFEVYSSTGGHLIVDVAGWFTGPTAPESSDGLLVLVDPIRAMDTRSDGRDRFWPDGSQAVDTTASTGRVAAVVANVTMTDTAGWGFVTAFPAQTAKPAISTVNADRSNQTVANLTVVPSGSTGLFLHSSTTAHVIVDVIGWFTGTPVAPTPDAHVLWNERPPGPDCTFAPPGHSAMVDRVAQRMWLCDDGWAVTGWMPFTAGPINDAPAGEYRVFFKSNPWYGAGYTLAHFTAFTRGDQGGRVAFHRYVAMSESQVGTEAFRNVSHGCFRMRAADAAFVYSFLGYGDRVRILNNG
jgi:hypothetical protein